MRNLFKLLLLTLICHSTFSITAQLSGTYSVPGSFTSVASAISSLNVGGNIGPTTINIAAGHTETTTFGGFQLNSNNFAITFRKNGSGPNPLLIAYSGGVGSPTSAVNQDGLWRFVGCDNITIDGIDLLDPNTSVPDMMEYGYGFFKASSTNGCHNNTIKNCVITLNKLNEESGSFGMEDGGSKGIYLSCATNTYLTQSANISNFSGTNSFNKFYSNKIENCHIGMSLIGYNDYGYILTSDRLNDVGGSSAATSNTIVNFGGGTISVFCAGILASYQYSLNASYNNINNNDGSGLNPQGSAFGIRAKYYSSGATSINNNTITLSVPSNSNSLYPQVYGIECAASTTIASITATANITINNNVFPSFTSDMTSLSSGNACLIRHSVNPSNTSISYNLMQNINLGNVNFEAIYCAIASSCNIISNTITSLALNPTAVVNQGGIRFEAINNMVSNNLVSGINFSSLYTGNFTGIYGLNNLKHASVSSNTVSNIIAQSCTGIFLNSSINQATFNILNNYINYLLSPLSATVSRGVSGIGVGSSGAGSSAIISGNTIFSLSILSAASPTNISSSIYGIRASNVSPTISGNKLYGFSSDAFGAYIHGIYMTASGYRTSEVSNNIVLDLENTASNFGFISGIRSQGVNSNIVFNSVYLSGVASNTNTRNHGITIDNFSTNGLSNVTNNIIVNNCPVTGAGEARGIAISGIAYYGAQSDRNIIHVGAPAPNGYIASVGTTNYATIAAFKSAVFPRDVQTFTENPVFTTTVGSMPNVLSLNPTVTTLAESGAVPISGILTDYAGTIRNSLSPDIGAWEDNFSGFERVPPLVMSSGFTTLPCNNVTSRTFTMAITEASGVAAGSLSPRLYYKVNSGSYTSVQGVLSAGTSTNGVWTFNLSYSATFGNTISYYVVIQDLSSFNNITVFPSGGGVVLSVSNVITHPSMVGSYVLQNYPTINVNSGGICLGKTFTMSPSGASTYTFSNGSPTVSPVVNTSYTITGTSLSGCLASVAAVCNVSIYPNPTITVNSGGVCKGKSYTLVASGANSYTYSAGPVITPLFNTSYSVTGKSAAGCLATNTAVASITVNPLPVINISTTNTMLCTGETATLTASGAFTYTYNTGHVAANIIVTPSVTTVYDVTATDVNGCGGNASFMLHVIECAGILKVHWTHGDRVTIYPNPSQGLFNFELDSENNVVIMNTIGQIVYSSKLNYGNHQINLEDLAKGIYIVKLNNLINSKSFKIVKE